MSECKCNLRESLVGDGCEEKQHMNTAQAEMHKLVDQFYADWKARRLGASDEAKWPLMMTSEEWLEQFIIWMQEANGLPAVDA